jgi:hypothetical protein
MYVYVWNNIHTYIHTYIHALHYIPMFLKDGASRRLILYCGSEDAFVKGVYVKYF